MNEEDLGTSFEDSLAGWDAKPIKAGVRRKRVRHLTLNPIWNASDSLFRAEEHIRQVEDNLFHWKWATICLHNSLYTFALTVAAGSNPYTVMKGDRVIDFISAVERCSGVKRYGHSVPFEITRSQKNSVLWLHKHLRNNFEHFSPQQIWCIGLSGWPNMCIDVLEAIRFLALDGRNIVYHTKAKEEKIGRSIKKSIAMLKSSEFYSNGDLVGHPMLAVNRTRFSIAYDGAARPDWTQKIRMAVVKLFKAANRRLNGKDIEVALKCEDMKPGSLKFSLKLTRISQGRPVEFLLGGEAADAWWLRKLVPGERGLLWLLKMLEGRVPDEVKKNCPIPGCALFAVGDERFEVCAELSKLYRDIEVRMALEELIYEFLKLEHMENFEVRCEDGPPEPSEPAQTVSKLESGYFSLAKGSNGETILESVRQTLLHIVSPSFEENDKWSFRDGDVLIEAAVADRDFLRRVDSGEVSFAKGDALACRMRTVRKRAGRKHECIVKSVVDIVPAPRRPQ